MGVCLLSSLALANKSRSGHHFYAAADPSAASQSTWTHPYDNPAFLSSLPTDHPANPHSAAAQAHAQKGADEAAASSNGSSGAGQEKGWLAKTIGKVIGDGPGTEEKRAIKVYQQLRLRYVAAANTLGR